MLVQTFMEDLVVVVLLEFSTYINVIQGSHFILFG